MFLKELEVRMLNYLSSCLKLQSFSPHHEKLLGSKVVQAFHSEFFAKVAYQISIVPILPCLALSVKKSGLRGGHSPGFDSHVSPSHASSTMASQYP